MLYREPYFFSRCAALQIKEWSPFKVFILDKMWTWDNIDKIDNFEFFDQYDQFPSCCRFSLYRLLHKHISFSILSLGYLLKAALET